MRNPIFLIAVLVIGMIAMESAVPERGCSARGKRSASELDTRQISLEAEVSHQMDNAARLQARIAELEGTIAASSQTSDQAQTRQAQLEADNALLVQRIIALQVERDQFAAQAQTLAQENQRLNQHRRPAARRDGKPACRQSRREGSGRPICSSAGPRDSLVAAAGYHRPACTAAWSAVHLLCSHLDALMPHDQTACLPAAHSSPVDATGVSPQSSQPDAHLSYTCPLCAISACLPLDMPRSVLQQPASLAIINSSKRVRSWSSMGISLPARLGNHKGCPYP
jgi:hypothetical protein